MAKLYNETGFEKPVAGDDTCQGMLNYLKPVVESYCGQQFPSLSCVEYSKRPAFGTNYRIRAQAGDGNFMHINAYEPVGQKPQLNTVERGRLADDELLEPVDMRFCQPTVKRGSFWIRDQDKQMAFKSSTPRARGPLIRKKRTYSPPMNNTFSYREQRRVEAELDYSETYSFMPLINESSRLKQTTPIHKRPQQTFDIPTPKASKKLTSRAVTDFLVRNYSKPLQQNKERKEAVIPVEEPLGPEYTFQPEITDRSREIVIPTKKTLYERSLKYMQEKKDKLNESKIEIEESQLESCTFHPDNNYKVPEKYTHITRSKPQINSYSKLHRLKRRK